MRKRMNKNVIYKFIIFFFNLNEKFTEKQSTKSFLVNENYICPSVNIF